MKAATALILLGLLVATFTSVSADKRRKKKSDSMEKRADEELSLGLGDNEARDMMEEERLHEKREPPHNWDVMEEERLHEKREPPHNWDMMEEERLHEKRAYNRHNLG